MTKEELLEQVKTLSTEQLMDLLAFLRALKSK